ncbi:hypothetical protein EYF80_053310 [Liparis tanakae]|uniref:Uncharacterized protein n=1 Tax=Liparis tanakae TaxID=230148 RepID=A0A4Z2F6N8_9TELE|nr:hypothetical protein EYF80_053310 [Liparis tanakae]
MAFSAWKESRRRHRRPLDPIWTFLSHFLAGASVIGRYVSRWSLLACFLGLVEPRSPDRLPKCSVRNTEELKWALLELLHSPLSKGPRTKDLRRARFVLEADPEGGPKDTL